MIFQGSATAMVTPFTSNGNKIDFKAFAKQIDYQIENGTSALVVLGTTGEPPTLSTKEKVELVKFAIMHTNSRIPVIVGAGSNNTKQAVQNAKMFEKLGADALLCVTPYYNKCTQEGLFKHYSQIAQSTNLPIILYNVPGRTNVNMLPQTVQKLAQIPNIVALKEASGNLEQVEEIIKCCPSNFTVYSGDDGIVLPILSVGGCGVISVISNILPQKMAELCESYFQKNIELSRKHQFEMLSLIKLLFCEPNPIPVKSAMRLLEMNSGTVRLPLTELNENNVKLLKIELQKLGYLQ